MWDLRKNDGNFAVIIRCLQIMCNITIRILIFYCLFLAFILSGITIYFIYYNISYLNLLEYVIWLYKSYIFYINFYLLQIVNVLLWIPLNFSTMYLDYGPDQLSINNTNSSKNKGISYMKPSEDPKKNPLETSNEDSSNSPNKTPIRNSGESSKNSPQGRQGRMSLQYILTTNEGKGKGKQAPLGNAFNPIYVEASSGSSRNPINKEAPSNSSRNPFNIPGQLLDIISKGKKPLPITDGKKTPIETSNEDLSNSPNKTPTTNLVESSTNNPQRPMSSQSVVGTNEGKGKQKARTLLPSNSDSINKGKKRVIDSLDDDSRKKGKQKASEPSFERYGQDEGVRKLDFANDRKIHDMYFGTEISSGDTRNPIDVEALPGSSRNPLNIEAQIKTVSNNPFNIPSQL